MTVKYPSAGLTDQKTAAVEILKYTAMLCESLRQNFIDYSIRRHEFMMPSSDNPTYHEEAIAKLQDGICDYDFTFETGRKYHKVIMNAHGSRSVHAFIDKNTGDVYKSASFKAPAAGVRYNLMDTASRELCFQRCDWSGGYLYLR